MSGFASIYGGGSDDIDSGSGDDMVLAGTGDDELTLGSGDDTAYGGTGDDLIAAGTGDDRLIGGSGDDTLVGGGGNDTMEADSGADTFEFDDGFGHDLIIGFHIGDDTLQIANGINGTAVAAPADLLPLISADSFGNAVITLGGDTITLQGITVGDLTANLGSIVQVV